MKRSKFVKRTTKDEVQIIMCNDALVTVVDGTKTASRTVLDKMRHADHQKYNYTHPDKKITRFEYNQLFYWHRISISVVRMIKGTSVIIKE